MVANPGKSNRVEVAGEGQKMDLRGVVWPNPTPRAFKPLKHTCLIILSACSVFAATTSDPKPLGKLVDLGGHRLHVNCTGKGSPTVVVENGLGDFYPGWTLVQGRVAAFTPIRTYDR